MIFEAVLSIIEEKNWYMGSQDKLLWHCYIRIIVV